VSSKENSRETPESEAKASQEASAEADRGSAQAPPEPDGELVALQARVEELESQLAEASARHLRLAADFDNHRKRSRQDQLDTIRYASSELVGRLLPVLDDLHRTIEHAPAGVDESWRKGLELSVQKLEEVLEAQGVKPIEAVGERFDPSRHEAIGTEESEEHPEDTVVSELRRGYQLHDRVLRPALVRVARPALRAPG